MAEALPPEVERLASFGRALEGTLDVTQEDVDGVPSDEGPPLQAEKPDPQPRQICWYILRRNVLTCTEFVQDFARKQSRMRMFLQLDGTS